MSREPYDGTESASAGPSSASTEPEVDEFDIDVRVGELGRPTAAAARDPFDERGHRGEITDPPPFPDPFGTEDGCVTPGTCQDTCENTCPLTGCGATCETCPTCEPCDTDNEVTCVQTQCGEICFPDGGGNGGGFGTGDTCPATACGDTCPDTECGTCPHTQCGDTCFGTCDTCPLTDCGDTCPNTQCGETCENTCHGEDTCLFTDIIEQCAAVKH